MTFRPKFITFDCHGTMIYFDMAGAARDHYGAQLGAEKIEVFIRDFSAYRLDEVLGAWKPYAEVVHNALERTCKRNGVAFDPAVAARIYDRVPSWGPHPDVPAGLARIAPHDPAGGADQLDERQIPHNIAKLGAPIAHVFTAESAQRLQAADAGLRVHVRRAGLRAGGCAACVSSSFRYDLMTAHDLGIRNKVWVNRGHEPANPFYGYTEIKDISGLPGVVGL